MSPILPEVRDELLAAAHRQRARRRPLRNGMGSLVLGACAITGATAIAAGTGMLDLGTGATRDGSRYTVVAVTSGAEMCLALSVTSPSGRTGSRPSCTPRPVDEPLSQWGVVHVDGERLVTGIVNGDVAAVTIHPLRGAVELHAVDGSQYRYFDVLVTDDTAAIEIVARDDEGRPLTVIDEAELGIAPGEDPASR